MAARMVWPVSSTPSNWSGLNRLQFQTYIQSRGKPQMAYAGDRGSVRTMKRNPQVIAFMTPFPYSVDVDAPLKEAHAMMREHGFRHLPVTSGDAIVGVLTDRDIKLVLGPDFDHPKEEELSVRDAYVEQPCVVSASTPVATVARTMAENRIGSAIVAKNGKLVGIFTVTDACRALAQVLEGPPGEESNDAA
jgi:acetoin utilization protein AcuB